MSISTNKRQDNTHVTTTAFHAKIVVNQKNRACMMNSMHNQEWREIKTESRIVILFVDSYVVCLLLFRWFVRSFVFFSFNKNFLFFCFARIVLCVGYARALFCYQCRSVTGSLSVEQPSSQLFEFLFLFEIRTIIKCNVTRLWCVCRVPAVFNAQMTIIKWKLLHYFSTHKRSV